MKYRIVACLASLALMTSSVAHAAIGLVTSVDPLLGAPILYDSGVPLLGGGFATPSLDSTVNGGLHISGLEVLGPGVVFTMTDDGLTGPTVSDSSVVQLNLSPGPGGNFPVGALEPFVVNQRGYDLTVNPGSGLLGVAGAALTGPGPLPGIFEFDPAGIAPPVMYAPTTARATTSGLTYAPGGASAILSTDGIPGGSPIPPLAGGIYFVPAGGPEGPGILDAFLPPGGVESPGDDHVITLDGRLIFLNDGSNKMHDVSGGVGFVFPMIDLTTIPAVAPSLSGGGVRGAVSPVDGDIFTGWGLGGPLFPPGGSNLLRVDDFGLTASVAVIGLDNVRDVDFGPSTFGIGPGTTGVSMYITEIEGAFSNIWEIPILVPEPSSFVLAGLGVLGLAWAASRRRRLA